MAERLLKMLNTPCADACHQHLRLPRRDTGTPVATPPQKNPHRCAMLEVASRGRDCVDVHVVSDMPCRGRSMSEPVHCRAATARATVAVDGHAPTPDDFDACGGVGHAPPSVAAACYAVDVKPMQLLTTVRSSDVEEGVVWLTAGVLPAGCTVRGFVTTHVNLCPASLLLPSAASSCVTAPHWHGRSRHRLRGRRERWTSICSEVLRRW